MLTRHLPLAAGLFLLALGVVAPQLAAQTAPAVLDVEGLGKGAAPLDGPWQFHTGDNAAFAQPQTADATGTAGWEQLSTDKTWGEQGHPAYVGYAWYRKHIHFSPAPGASPEFFLLIREVDNAYEVYWNGRLMGSNGTSIPSARCPGWS